MNNQRATMRTSPQPPPTWSAQYSVSSSLGAKIPPGDKVTLPPSALQALLSTLPSPTEVNTRPDAEQTQQLPYPLTFRLVNPQNGRVVYAGIREFSAEEGTALLSPFLRQTLDLKDDGATKEDAMVLDSEGEVEPIGPKITVHARQLPRGTFVKLRPLEAGYDPEDWKALLEQHLRQNYTTLTNGEVLVVPHGRGLSGHKEEYRFLVDGFKPEDADAVCIVDTDLEVDIEALNEEQARETLKRIADKMRKEPGTQEGSSFGGEIDLFKAQEGQILPGEYVDYQLSSWHRSQPLDIELSAAYEDEDLELFASPLSPTQRAKPRMDEHVFADFDSRPRKRLRLEPTNVELEHAEELYISVHAWAPQVAETNGHAGLQEPAIPIRFTLRAHHPDQITVSTDSAPSQSDAPPNPEDVRCKNCNQWVPQRTLLLHENFCLRNNILCPQGCGQVFQKRSADFDNHWHCPHDSTFGNTSSSQAKHDHIFHPASILRCTDCSTQETFPSIPALAHHRTSTCPAKPILCRFCHLVVPQEGDPDVPNGEALLSGMTPHELADGARTTECHLCTRIVRLRDMETHLKNHDLDRFSRPPPIVCRNVLCGRTVDGCTHSGNTRARKADNDLGFCSTCFGPLYVSMYDPDNKALVRRIERRYLQQFVTGCGKQHCRNEFCKTGRNNLGMEKPNLTMKEAMPVIKPAIEALKAGETGSALHFCVDEGSQQRRKLAEMLAAEKEGGAFGFGWCVGALEAESGALEEARQWLKNYAPN